MDIGIEAVASRRGRVLRNALFFLDRKRIQDDQGDTTDIRRRGHR
jgi:hypothetical protein